MNFEKFKSKIGSIFNSMAREAFKLELNENEIIFEFENNTYTYTKETFDNFDGYSEIYQYNDVSIYTPNECEILIEETNHPIIYDRMLDMEPIIDNEHKIKYSLIKPSPYLMYKFLENNDIENYIMRVPPFLHDFDYTDEDCIFSLISIAFRRFICIKIESKESWLPHEYETFSDSILFSFAYNTNHVFRKLSNIDEMFMKKGDHKPLSKKNKLNELMAPRLSFNKELTEQYYMALSSNDIYVKFLCYYHIFEFFFEEIYQEELFKSIKEIILNPSFSLKKNKDIAKIIETVNKKNKQNKPGFQGNELEALELTLEKYIDCLDLVNCIEPCYIQYYKNCGVPFSSGDAIDLTDVNNQKIFKKLAARIYKTRNALVHSKSNDFRLKEKGIYHPFSDKSALEKEIPLMKYIAEVLIIKTAKEL